MPLRSISLSPPDLKNPSKLQFFCNFEGFLCMRERHFYVFCSRLLSNCVIKNSCLCNALYSRSKIARLSLSYMCAYVFVTCSTVSPINSATTMKFAPKCISIDTKECRKS